ncbi:hypothetical protein [Chryseobacterium mucoviscidosis]|uniref:hypothetical protein n=1 Tax=Chryseobacterium mucoviscidosis TaxID=1945581 RepID=UPI000F4E20A3|nr:hypothetical protein [Chryseobacterium mucoviscidosis]
MELFKSRIDIGYERIINYNAGIGSYFIYQWKEKYTVMPYYRFYTDNEGIAKNFFIEALAIYNRNKYSPLEDNGQTLNNEKWGSSLGIGAGVGEKYVFLSNLFVEAGLEAGIVKNLSASDRDQYGGLFRLFISAGYRF